MHVVSNDKDAILAVQSAADASVGCPTFGGVSFGNGCNAGPVETAHVADILESDDGKSWAFPSSSVPVGLDIGAKCSRKDLAGDAAWSRGKLLKQTRGGPR